MRKVECDEHSGNYLLHKIQKWLKAIHNDFLSGLNQKGSVSNGSKTAGFVLLPQDLITC